MRITPIKIHDSNNKNYKSNTFTGKKTKLSHKDEYFKRQGESWIGKKVRQAKEFIGIDPNPPKESKRPLVKSVKNNITESLGSEQQEVIPSKEVLTSPKPVPSDESFIPKPKFTCGEENPVQFAKEKFEYMQKVMNRMDKNETSALEGLDMFKKYGEKVRYGEYNEGDTLTDLTVAVSCLEPAPTDKVLRRFVEVYNSKIKEKGENNAHRASGNLRYLLSNHSKEMSKDTALMYVDAMKRTSFDRNDAYEARSQLLENVYDHFTKQEIEEMRPHVEELEELLKDCKYLN
jgi:hypothetical protein